MLILFSLLLLSVFSCYARQPTNDWNYDYAFNTLQFALIAYCPSDQIMAWDCCWCQNASSAFQPAIVSYDDPTDTTAYVGVDPISQQIIISFRGTDESNIPNWITDIDIVKTTITLGNYGQVSVHEGFYDAWTEHRQTIINTVIPLMQQNPTFTLLSTGHSLGAAMATLCAVDLFFNYNFPLATLINFGSPRVGDQDFSKIVGLYFDAWRVVHNDDIVPHMPPEDAGFYHIATEIWETPNPHGGQDIYTICDGSGEDPRCSNSVSVLDYTVSDHLSYMQTTWIPCDTDSSSVSMQ